MRLGPTIAESLSEQGLLDRFALSARPLRIERGGAAAHGVQPPLVLQQWLNRERAYALSRIGGDRQERDERGRSGDYREVC